MKKSFCCISTFGVDLRSSIWLFTKLPGSLFKKLSYGQEMVERLNLIVGRFRIRKLLFELVSFEWYFVSLFFLLFLFPFDLWYSVSCNSTWPLVRLSEKKFGYFCWNKDKVNFSIFLIITFCLVFIVSSLWSLYKTMKWYK